MKQTPSPQKTNSEKFWKLATKWYFFPTFYLLLCVLLRLIQTFLGNSEGSLLFIIANLPMGIPILLDKMFNISEFGGKYFPTIMHSVSIVSAIVIILCKRKNIILKWLIISLMLLFLLEFSGCLIYVLNRLM